MVSSSSFIADRDLPWQQLWLRVGPADLERVCDLLWTMACRGLEMVDSSHPNPPGDLGAGQVEIRASFEPGIDFAALENRLGDVPSRVVTIKGEDWEEGWKRFFVPTRVGRFSIHPKGEAPDPEAPFAVRIDPGLAFGTGLHPTTRLCLAALDSLPPAASLLDVGCGSGILAIAAVRAGTARVVGVDTDAQACRVARANVAANDLSAAIEILDGGIEQVTTTFKLVVANILSSVLAALAPALAQRTEAGGTLLLSGLLVEEADQIAAVFSEHNFSIQDRQDQDEWSLLQLRRSQDEGKPS